MKFPKHILAISALCFGAMQPSSVQAKCPGPGCPASKGLLGAAAGVAVINQLSNKSHDKQSASQPRTPMSAQQGQTQRQQNRDVQTALNALGFDTGVADGVIGPKSRLAISQFQAANGMAATGQLTKMERNFLMSSYYSAIGRDSNRSVTVALAAPAPLPAKQLELVDYCPSDEDTRMKLAESTLKKSAADRLCDIRRETITIGEERAATIDAMTPQQISDRCNAAGAFVVGSRPANWRELPPQDSIDAIKAMLIKSGYKPVEMLKTAEICTGDGFNSDQSRQYVANAMLGVAAGQQLMAEVVGLHLALTSDQDKVANASNWLSYAYEGAALSEGPSAETQKILIELFKFDPD